MNPWLSCFMLLSSYLQSFHTPKNTIHKEPHENFRLCPEKEGNSYFSYLFGRKTTTLTQDWESNQQHNTATSYVTLIIVELALMHWHLYYVLASGTRQWWKIKLDFNNEMTLNVFNFTYLLILQWNYQENLKIMLDFYLDIQRTSLPW